MKKITVFLFMFLLSLTLVQAQLLWKVTGNGLKQPSYLFGTYHFIPIQFLDSVPGLYKAFNNTSVTIGEMVYSNLDAMAKIQQAAIMPKHIKMTDLLSEDDYKLVDTELKSVMKIGLKNVDIMNPSLILTMYELELYKKSTGFSDDVQSDSYFQLVATEKDKKVVGLETIEQQIAVLYGNASLERQADILMASILHKDSILNEMKQMIRLYKTGKIEEMVELSNKKGNVIDMTEEEYARQIDKRNTDWMTKIPALFKQSGCFVAVGVLHLGGQNGLIKLLEKQGYRVIPDNGK